MQIFLFVVALTLFFGLVLVHELGHLLAARSSGVEAEEFGLGFPPRIASKKLKSGLILSLNWLPLGGFVKLRGEHDDDDRAGSFGAAKLSAKVKIMLAGVTMNLLAGFVLLMILAWIGMPVLIDKTIAGQSQFTINRDTKVSNQKVLASDVIVGSPAAKAGLKNGDTIQSLRAGAKDYQINTADQLHSITQSLAGKIVKITYSRHGTSKTKTVHLLAEAEVKASLNTNSPKGYLGVAPSELSVRRSTWSAPVVAAGLSAQFWWLTLDGIGHAFGGLGSWIAGSISHNHSASVKGQTQAESQVGGPVAIGQILWYSGALGINFVLMLIAVISLTLALVNLLPIPALDGGRLFMTLVARGLFKRPLSQKTEARLVGASYMLLFGLLILITIADVKRTF